MKTPLEHVQGIEHHRGDPVHGRRLAEAFRITEDERDAATTGLYGLHPYPGRMHPLWARRLIGALAPDASILDPFCGGGTVLVEARLQGRYARGSDVNPIAVRLARLRCIPHADPDVVTVEAERCATECTRRRDTPFSSLAQGERDFPRHVLAGLISLRDEIEKTSDPKTKELLLFCLSPLLGKLSARQHRDAPRVPRTAVRDQFLKRVTGWLEAWKVLDEHGWAEVEAADARWLPWKPGSSSAVITSPPYPGVYDYAAEQRRRTRWLAGDVDVLRKAGRAEIGRRDASPDWRRGMSTVLSQLCRCTRPKSPMVFVVGDGVMRGKVVRADRALEDLCEGLPLRWVATASQSRPHFHGSTAPAFKKRARQEHLVLLERQ